MRGRFAKFGFVHRRLWERDGTYRLVLLAGPAPLFGLLIAAAVWGGSIAVRLLTYQQPPWATLPASTMWNTDDDKPQVVKAARPLLQNGSGGPPSGYQPGWNASARPVVLGPLMDVSVKPNALATFVLSGPVISMSDIQAAAHLDAAYVAVGTGFFVVKNPGAYALAARLERRAGPIATCLTELGFGPRLITFFTQLNVTSPIARNYPAASFDLQPGLYAISWAFGCWRDQQVSDVGQMTILVRRPGETVFQPARLDDFVH